VPDILDPPAPEIGVGTTTIYPLPPDLGGTIFDPPAPDLGQGNETYPIEGPWQFVNFNSDSTLPKRVLRGGLWSLMLISAWLGWRNHRASRDGSRSAESRKLSDGAASRQRRVLMLRSNPALRKMIRGISLLRVTCSPAG
jgi:hypothetical protein